MQRAEILETVERATLLNKVIAYFSIALNKIFFKNKDPCYKDRFLYLRI